MLSPIENTRTHIRNAMGNYPFEFSNAHVPKQHIEQLKECLFFHMSQENLALVRSHSLLYKRLLESQDPWIIIAEDDIEIVPNFSKKLQRVIQKLPTNFDVVKLEYCNKQPTIQEQVSIEEGQGGACTGLYIVSRNGAELLLEINPPETPCAVTDGVMDSQHPSSKRGHRKIIIYHVVPPLGWQNHSEKIWNNGEQH